MVERVGNGEVSAMQGRSLFDWLGLGGAVARDVISGLRATGLDKLLSGDGGLNRLNALPGPIERFPQAARDRVVTVSSGDTLDGIARANGTTWQALARLNNLSNPDLIRLGQQIRLPANAGAIHIVRGGDTLSAIAARNGTTVAALIVHNPQIPDANRIYPGQHVRINGQARSPIIEHVNGGRTPQSDLVAENARRPEGTHRLGSLSEVYESGNRGPGTVSSGQNDPGGVSYGVYQLSSRAGTLGSFLRNEGQSWAGELAGASPGTRSFADTWRAIAARDPAAFRDAQHNFIERTHYQPAVAAVLARTNLNLDSRSNAVRDAAWSVGVQHAGAATILNRAVAATDAQLLRTDGAYDRALLGNIYAERTSYVLNVAHTSTRLTANERAQLISVTQNRYPNELRDALRMLDGQDGQRVITGAPAIAAGTIDGNAVARANGVMVKSNAVAISQLDPRMGPVIAAVAQAARTLGLPTPVITSGNDSRHSEGSLHYANKALDFRGNNITGAQGQRFEAEVQRLLGSQYFVDFETFANSSNNHLHVEFDPS